MVKIGILIVAIIVGILLFLIYGNSIHNQYFSSIAKIDRSIDSGDSCADISQELANYKNLSPDEVFFEKRDINDQPQWQHKDGVEYVLTLNDSSTPFDLISYYVFCSNEGRVIETLLVGD